MIIIHGLRCGYDGGGMACGPVPGSALVELKTVVDGLIHFVFVSQYDGFEKTVISKRQMFDTFIDMAYNDIDWGKQTEETMREAIEDYDYELGDEPEALFSSKFAKAIHLARLAMQKFEVHSDLEDYTFAAKFIDEYIGKDVDELELPELEVFDDEDYDEE